MSSNTTIASRPNPYVGTRPFKKGETLYGREQETSELLDLLIAERIVMLYSPSGAGKSSILNASVLPKMEENGFEVLPITRLNYEPPEGAEGTPGFNRYIYSMLVAFEDGVPLERRFPTTDLLTLRLKDYLTRHRQRTKELNPDYDETRAVLIVVDQGEEIITISPTERTQKQDFFVQLGEILRDRSVWLLYSLREDYVARLDSYIKPIPTGFATRYRLRLLQAEAALPAIQKPAEHQGVTFNEDAARKLADDLRLMQVQQADGTSEEQLGLYVEPVQLQVVCRRLWSSLERTDNEIGVDDIERIGDVNTALADYYRLQVATVAAKTGVRERAIRDWFDRKLITKQGIRGQVLLAPGKSDGLENKAIQELERTYLVRSEKRGGSTWYELAHDRLIQPVRGDNTAWFDANLSNLQRAADVWSEQGRSEGFLLFGKDYLEAEKWAAKNADVMLPSENEFLAACRKFHQQQLAEKRTHRIVQGLLALSLVALVVAVVMFFRARRAETLAQTRQLAADSVSSLEVDPELGVLLALRAMQKTNPPQDEAIDAMHLALPAMRLMRTFTGHKLRVYSVAYSPDGKTIASASLDGTVKVWDVASGKALQSFSITSNPASSGATFVAFNPDGSLLAAANGSGEILLWNTQTWEAATRKTDAHPGATIWGLAFSPDGKLLASAGGDGLAHTWNVPDLSLAQTFTGHNGPIWAVTFSPDGKRIATASDDQTARIWDVIDGKEVFSFNPRALSSTNPPRVMGVAFNAEGTRLATSTTAGNIWVWDAQTGDKNALMRIWGHEDWVYSVAFKTDGTLVSSGADRTIRLWDGKYGRSRLELRGHTDQVFAFAMNTDQSLLVSASADNSIRLWDISWAGNHERFTVDNLGFSQDVDYSPDGSLIASPVIIVGDDGETADLTAPAAVALFDSQTGALKAKLEGHTRGVTSVDFSSNGKHLVSSSWDRTAIIWDLASAKPLATLTGHDRPVLSADYSADGKKIATSDRQGMIKIWDADTGQESKSFEPKLQDGYIDQVQFSPDGTLLAVQYHESSYIYFIDPESGELKITLTGHRDIVRDFDFSPDGTKFVSVGDDVKIFVWDLRPATPDAQRRLTEFSDHLGTLFSVTFSTDGKKLLSSGADGLIKVWEMADKDGKKWVETYTLYVYALGDEDTVLDIELSPDDKHVVAVVDDWTIRGYTLDYEELMQLARSRLTRDLTCFEREKFLGETCQP